MNLNDVLKFVQAALECSVYHAPLEPGLTYQELLEAGKRAGFQPGELGDAISKATIQYIGHGAQKLLPAPAVMTLWAMFVFPQDPDYRNHEAFDFVYSELTNAVRAEGAAIAKIERSVIVERATAKQIRRLDIEAAITFLVLAEQFAEKDGIIRFTQRGTGHASPQTQRTQRTALNPVRRNEMRVQAYAIVKDIVERRTDGRLKQTEPLDAFGEALTQLGYGRLRLWWTQTVAELRRSDAQSSPVSVSVLAAALVEGALASCVNHARNLGLGVFGSKSFEDPPYKWQIGDLVSSAASGKDTAILDEPTRLRTLGLIKTRQRIHAGRMLTEYPGAIPDLRPEEAREAKAIAEQIVRRILDGLQRYPPSVSSGGT